MALNIGISIGKHDLDIAAWFNMLKRNKLPITSWINAITLAYLAGQSLDIGTIQEVQSIPKPATAGILFGAGSSQISKRQKKERGWAVKGSNGEFIEGSIIQIRITNKQVSIALEEMKKHGVGYATAVKMLIRKYLKKGPQESPPKEDNSAKNMQIELLNSLRDEILKSLSNIEQEHGEQKKKASSKTLQKKPNTPHKVEQEKKEITHPEKTECITNKNPLLSLIN